jgi:hypothetical protein
MIAHFVTCGAVAPITLPSALGAVVQASRSGSSSAIAVPRSASASSLHTPSPARDIYDDFADNDDDDDNGSGGIGGGRSGVGGDGGVKRTMSFSGGDVGVKGKQVLSSLKGKVGVLGGKMSNMFTKAKK